MTFFCTKMQFLNERNLCNRKFGVVRSSDVSNGKKCNEMLTIACVFDDLHCRFRKKPHSHQFVDNEHNVSSFEKCLWVILCHRRRTHFVVFIPFRRFSFCFSIIHFQRFNWLTDVSQRIQRYQCIVLLLSMYFSHYQSARNDSSHTSSSLNRKHLVQLFVSFLSPLFLLSIRERTWLNFSIVLVAFVLKAFQHA